MNHLSIVFNFQFSLLLFFCRSSCNNIGYVSSQQVEQQRMLNKSFSNLNSIQQIRKELEANNWQIIDLSHNSIEFIDSPELLKMQTSLELIQIDFNTKFNGKGNKTIFIQKNLKRMSCNGCGFVNIHSQHFAGFDSLEVLNLRANKINQMDADAFKGNRFLRVLDLSENQLKRITLSTFSASKSFHELYISSNPIDLPKNKPLLKCESLKRLTIDSCNLTDIYTQTFTEIPNIIELKLSYNRIESFPVDALKLNKNLKSLFIEGNRLKFFPASILDYLPQLTELCADKNSYVNSQEFINFVKKYDNRFLRTARCNSEVDFFIENLFPPSLNGKNEHEELAGNSTDEKSSKFINDFANKGGISNFFIGSYLTIILIVQGIIFVMLTVYLIKITKYEKLGTGSGSSSGDVNYANTILNDNDIYKVYKLND